MFSTASIGDKRKCWGSLNFGGIYGAGELLPDSQSDSALSSKLFSHINTSISAMTFHI
jgi:hypothetical protein